MNIGSCSGSDSRLRVSGISLQGYRLWVLRPSLLDRGFQPMGGLRLWHLGYGVMADDINPALPMIRNIP